MISAYGNLIKHLQLAIHEPKQIAGKGQPFDDEELGQLLSEIADQARRLQ